MIYLRLQGNTTNILTAQRRAGVRRFEDPRTNNGGRRIGKSPNRLGAMTVFSG